MFILTAASRFPDRFVLCTGYAFESNSHAGRIWRWHSIGAIGATAGCGVSCGKRPAPQKFKSAGSHVTMCMWTRSVKLCSNATASESDAQLSRETNLDAPNFGKTRGTGTAATTTTATTTTTRCDEDAGQKRRQLRGSRAPGAPSVLALLKIQDPEARPLTCML